MMVKGRSADQRKDAGSTPCEPAWPGGTQVRLPVSPLGMMVKGRSAGQRKDAGSTPYEPAWPGGTALGW